MWRRHAWGVAAASLLAACNRGSHPSATACCLDESGRDAFALAEAGPRELEHPPEGARLRRDEGCARDFKATGTATRDLRELERLCAQGMAPILTTASTGNLAPGASFEIPFRVTATTACLRAGAVATSGGVSLSLMAGADDVLAASSSNEPLGLAPIDGTVCVREPGPYRVVVRSISATETSSVTVQIWQATRD